MDGLHTETSDYGKYYNSNLEEALCYQDFIMQKLHSMGIVLQNIQSKKYQLKKENLLGLEIKFDKRFLKTGNLYIETAEKANPQNAVFVPSGIFRDDNNWLFGIGNYLLFYIFSKKVLRRIFNLGNFREIKTATSRGFLLPKSSAQKICEKTFCFDGNNDGLSE